MAKRKKTTKRRNRSLSSGGAKRRTTKRRRSKSFLSEGSAGGKTMKVLKNTGSAMLGSLIGTQINGMIPQTWGKMPRLLTLAALTFAGMAANMPITTAGAVGSLAAGAFPKGFLNEANFASTDVLDEDTPLFLDENNNPMVLDDDGQGGLEYRYLNDDEIEMLERAGAFDNYTEV